MTQSELSIRSRITTVDRSIEAAERELQTTLRILSNAKEEKSAGYAASATRLCLDLVKLRNHRIALMKRTSAVVISRPSIIPDPLF